jgi:vitamin B12 transporter
LYSEYGNNALMPEYNKTVEVGYETFGLKNTFHFNVVSFIRFQKNSFGFATDPVTFASNYVNVDGTYTAKGFEVESKYELNSKLNVHSNYTFTQVDDALNKLIPKHKINTALTYVFNKKVNSTLTYQYNSEKRDVYFDGNSYSNNEVQLKSYQLVHVSSSFDCIPNRLSLFLFVNNVFNVDFTENFGYATQGRNVKMGLLFKF